MKKVQQIFGAIFFFVIWVTQFSMAQNPRFPSDKSVANAKAGQLVINRDTLKGYNVDYGILLVTESNRKKSKRIRLPVVRIHSKSQDPGYPVFYFEGGPGETNIKLDNLHDSLLQNHDFVRVGYRGVDGSVSLDLPEVNQILKETPNLLSTESLKILGNKIDQILEKFQQEKNIDLKEYNIINVVDDMETARKALGYKKINVSGTGYGGAVIYTFCLRYPASIYRALLTEAAFPFNMALAKPSSVDASLNNLNDFWKKNPENLRRSPDIVQTIKNVLKTLPKEVNGVTIDPDKIRLMTYLSLYTKEMTGWMLDVYISAENGDYNGLALANQMWNNVVDMFNWGDMLAKTYCTETGEIKDPEVDLKNEGSIIGSPLALLAWGSRKYSHWPVKPLPEEYKKPQNIVNDVLMVYSNKESAKWIEKDYLAFFKNGHLVNFDNLGHMDVNTAEEDAYQHMEKMFFLKGVIDISKFKNAVMK